MLLVIPVSEADAHLADDVLELLKAFGPYKHHDLLVVGTEENATAINCVLQTLSPLFNKSSLKLFQGGVKGWPLGPNFYWRSTILHLYESTGNIGQPWYWFELDNTPLKSGWLDVLQTEYAMTHSVYMGPKHVTHLLGTNGKLVIQGYHMVGTGIYPANFVELSNLWRVEGGIAFDIWIQFEVVPHLHDSPLMQHNWKTRNYRYENGSVVSDNFEMPHDDLCTNTPIRAEAVVCHGCKDGSLARLLLDGLNGKVAALIPGPDPLITSEAVTPRFDTEQLVFPKNRSRKVSPQELTV